MTTIDQLKDYTLLSALPLDQLAGLLEGKAIRLRSYARGEIIHFDGDRCDEIEIIIHGKVSIERIDEDGNLMAITQFQPDDILGGNLLFSSNPVFPMTVTAKEKVELLAMPKELVFRLCSESTGFLELFLEYISDHALLLGDRIKHYVNRTIRESIVAYLRNEHLIQGGSRIRLTTSKKALADRMGVQRTSLSRELQKMKNEGLIDYDADSITILDPQMYPKPPF